MFSRDSVAPRYTNMMMRLKRAYHTYDLRPESKSFLYPFSDEIELLRHQNEV